MVYLHGFFCIAFVCFEGCCVGPPSWPLYQHQDGAKDVKFSGCCVLDFPLGRGVVCDALDFAAATMCVGEEATDFRPGLRQAMATLRV